MVVIGISSTWRRGLLRNPADFDPEQVGITGNGSLTAIVELRGLWVRIRCGWRR